MSTIRYRKSKRIPSFFRPRWPSSGDTDGGGEKNRGGYTRPIGPPAGGIEGGTTPPAGGKGGEPAEERPRRPNSRGHEPPNGGYGGGYSAPLRRGTCRHAGTAKDRAGGDKTSIRANRTQLETGQRREREHEAVICRIRLDVSSHRSRRLSGGPVDRYSGQGADGRDVQRARQGT